MADLERLIIDNFKINSGGRTPGAKRADSLAMEFSSRATPHRLRFDAGAPLRSIENKIDVCRHNKIQDTCGTTLDNRLSGSEDKENSYRFDDLPSRSAAVSARLEFMDSADLTLLESPITSRQFNEINANRTKMARTELSPTGGKTPSKFAVARLHLKTPEHGWPKSMTSPPAKSPYHHMESIDDRPGPSKVPQLSLLSEYSEAETLHDLEAAFEDTSAESACSRYEIISTDSPETGRTCGPIDEMDADFVFGAPLAQTETTKSFNMLSRVPSNTTANRMLNFDNDKENSPRPKSGKGSVSLSFANRIKALKDTGFGPTSIPTGTTSSAPSWKRDSWSDTHAAAATPKISRCLNFGLERSRSEDSGYSPRNSESSRGSPIGPLVLGRSVVPKLLHTDSMESGCISEMSEDFNVYDHQAENVFKSSQETTMDIIFAMDESPRMPSSIKNLMSAPILNSHRVLEDHMETAEDAWSPSPRNKLLQDPDEAERSSPLYSFPAVLDEQCSLTPGMGGARTAFRRCISLNNPDVQQVRIKLFDSPTGSKDEVPSPFKIPTASSRVVSRPVKRLDPSLSESLPPDACGAGLGQQPKRARMRDPLRSCGKSEPVKTVRPLLQRSLSDNAANIKMALARSVAEPDLIGDFSRPFSLPLTPGKHSDLRAITPETLAMLINGQFSDSVDNFQVVDCRYPYEFEGGHISGALNLYQRDQVLETLLSHSQALPAGPHPASRRILVFHCEFSKERGPNLCRYLRWQDRAMHKEVYPRLMHPEIYLLHGGYRAFHRLYSHLCNGGYTKMMSPTHATKLKTFRTSAQSQGRKLI